MSLTFGKEVFERRGGRLEIGTGGSFTRTFLVTTDDPEVDGPYEACFCAGLPRLGDPFPSDPLYTCKTITPEPVANPAKSWFVTCEYSRRSNDPDDEPDNPLNEPVQSTFSSVKVRKPVTVDQSGAAIVNAADCAFDPPPEIERTHPTITFVRNEPFYSFATHSEPYVDHVNSATFSGADPGTVKCADITATQERENGQDYYKVTYQFEYNPDGWQLSLLNVGYMEKADGTNLTKIKDDNGRDVSTPWPLSVTGVAQGSPLTSASFNYLDFTVFPSVDFNNLGLPT